MFQKWYTLMERDLIIGLLTGSERYSYIDGYPKYERWAKRLGYKESVGSYE